MTSNGGEHYPIGEEEVEQTAARAGRDRSSHGSTPMVTRDHAQRSMHAPNEGDHERIRKLEASSRSLKQLTDDAQQLQREIDRHLNNLRRAGQRHEARIT
jgi:hypothetical protein